jgi:hypothetical protein
MSFVLPAVVGGTWRRENDGKDSVRKKFSDE